MIDFTVDASNGMVSVEPQGPLEASDFDELAVAVDAQIEAQGELRGLLIHAKSFPGWKDFAGMLAHLRFVREHHKRIHRVALVTDGDVLSVLPKIVDAFVSAEVRHFDYDALDEARSWVLV